MRCTLILEGNTYPGNDSLDIYSRKIKGIWKNILDKGLSMNKVLLYSFIVVK